MLCLLLILKGHRGSSRADRRSGQRHWYGGIRLSWVSDLLTSTPNGDGVGMMAGRCTMLVGLGHVREWLFSPESMSLPIPYGIRILCRPTYQFIYGQGPYASKLNDVEKDIQNWTNEKLGQPRTNVLCCSSKHFRRSKRIGHQSCFCKFLGLGRRHATNGRRTSQGHPLQVARCTKIFPYQPDRR